MRRKTIALAAGVAILIGTGCARPQPTQEQVASFSAPPDLHLGKTPPGGPSCSPTGAGAGGSAAAGYEVGRIGGIQPQPVLPPQPVGIQESRMSPVGSDGSNGADRGHPVPPDVPLVKPPTN